MKRILIVLALTLTACGSDTVTGPSVPPAPVPTITTVSAAPSSQATVYFTPATSTSRNCKPWEMYDYCDEKKGNIYVDWPYTIANGPVEIRYYEIRLISNRLPGAPVTARTTGPCLFCEKTLVPGNRAFHWEGLVSVSYHPELPDKPVVAIIYAEFLRHSDGSLITLEVWKNVEIRQ